MKEILTLKRFLTWLTTIILEAFISLLFENKLKDMSNFIETHFVGLFLTVLIFTTIFFLTTWVVIYTLKTLRLLRVKGKYYDIMLNKVIIENSTCTFLVQPQDLKIFTPEEKKYLDKHFEEMKQMRIYMKGTNEVLFQLGKYT